MRVPHRAPAGWLTRPQAGKYLGVSPSTFIRIVEEFHVPSVKDKSTHIYRVEDIEKVMRIINERKQKM